MHTLDFQIDYQHAHSGWISCTLVIDGEQHYLAASGVFPPFDDLLRFVRAVAGQRFPARFEWEEEGTEVCFSAEAVAQDSPLMRLKITHQEGDSEETWFDGELGRDIFIQAVLPAIQDFSKKFPLAEASWGLLRKRVARTSDAIRAGIPLRSDIHAAHDVAFEIFGGYGKGFEEGNVFIRLLSEDEIIFTILLFDNNPFWSELVDFIRKVSTGEFPAACLHRRVHVWKFQSPESPYETRIDTRLQAEQLAIPENFRLKVFEKFQDENEFLVWDEVVRLSRFVEGFRGAMRKFLAKEYHVIPDQDGKMFDLRSLSLD